MSETENLFYCEVDTTAPLVEWLVGRPAEARDRCIARLDPLAEKATSYAGRTLRISVTAFTNYGSSSTVRT